LALWHGEVGDDGLGDGDMGPSREPSQPSPRRTTNSPGTAGGTGEPVSTPPLPVSHARPARARAPAAQRRRRATGTLIFVPPSYLHDTMARRVRIQQLPNGQFVITIPKALAEAIGFRKGEEVQWSLEKEGLVLRRLTRQR